jgi:parvulin-like peptidyl-prolyl isomerase
METTRARALRSLIALALSIAPALCIAQIAPTVASAAVSAAAPFATVGELEIGRAQYEAAVAVAVRRKFYHAVPPQAEMAAFRREVGESLVERALLLREAKRRELQADRAWIDEVVADYDRRYATSERWRAKRDELLPPVIGELERQSLLQQMERAARAGEPPSERQVRAYYDARPEQFTEPEQVRLSLILLRVDPSSPRVAWEQAQQEAARIHEQVAGGADFAELARMHSSDPSAAKGGDLGYVHKGMLPPSIEADLIAALGIGESSPPVKILEGYALLKLQDRKPARLRDYDDVRSRAAELAERERAEQARGTLIRALRRQADIRIDEAVYQAALPQ